MESESTNEETIISKLQSSSDITGIHRLFIAFLHPFTPFFAPPTTTAKKPVKSSKSKPADDLPAIRPLAKQFLSFIHKSLSLIPKRLSQSPKIPKDDALELFDCYRLSLDCLDLIAPELAGKPHSVQVQRIRYIHCLENWEMFKEAEAEGFVVLESLNAIVRGGLKGKWRKSKARLVPELNEGTEDPEFAVIVLEIVVTLVKCASKRRSKMAADYWRVISLVNDCEPWFKVLDAKDYEKFHHFLETNLHITALFLVAEIKSFSVDLICEFSLVTFKEYKKSKAHDQIYKAALKICSSLFSQRDELSSDIIFDVLEKVLDFMAAECKDGEEETTLQFLELISYCANKCQSLTVGLCGPVAEYLCRLAGSVHEDFPFTSAIMRLYVSGLLAVSSNQSKWEDNGKCRNDPLKCGIQILLHNKEQLQQISISINLLNSHFHIGGKESNPSEKGISNSSYWEALKFLCQSLAESIFSNRKEFFSEEDNASSWKSLSSIHDAFHHFCNIFLQRLSTTERERETSGDNHRVISVVVVAALMLSFKTNQSIKESTLLVKHVISAQWLPVKRLKYLYVSLNNIAVILNRKKRLRETIKALKLSCKASWHYVVDLCKIHANRSQVSHDDISEKTIADFVIEASEKIAFLLELNQEDNFKINGIITESLLCWSISENLIATLPTPVSLVKEWVKIQYKLSKDTEHGVMLYSLLSSSKEISKKALGKLLEEELFAYEEKSYLHPRYCHRMKMKVISLLLEEVYVTEDTSFEKCRILIEKAKSLRAHGLPRLDECIACLSDAISTLKFIYSVRTSCSSWVHHLLIHAYILRALFTHEAAPSSKILSPKSDFLRDVHDALNLCLCPDHGHADKQNEDMLYLWYAVIDLLSIKGYLEIHPRLYDIVIKLFNEKNFSLAKTLTELWKNKRLSHALCASPVNDMFIRSFSKHQSQLCNSSEFWRTCTEEMKPLVVGCHHINNEIKQAVSDLISNVPLTSHSIFLSSNLYYELSGRLISSGQMIEALMYAKEAHRLRSKLLQQKFEYSVEKITETFDEKGETIEKAYYGIETFTVTDFVAKGSCDYEGCVLTPWVVLSCYLESILQVGFVQEILGNVSEAEMLLRWGRNVAQFQALPLFEISFACGLGKLYCKQKLWGVAEKELSRAKRTLEDNLDTISCKKCSCMLIVSINQQLGDLFLSSACCIRESPFTQRLLDAQSLYRSALDKLNLSDWKTSYSTPEDSLSNDKPETKIEPRRSRRTKKEVKPASQGKNVVCGHNRRMTRSVHRSLEETHVTEPSSRRTGTAYVLAPGHLSTSAGGSDHDVTSSDSESFSADFQSGIRSLCNNMKCLHCLLSETADCGNLNIFMCMNWELVHRKLCLRLLISIGKFSGIFGHVHEAHENLLHSISVLFSRNSYCSKHSSDSLDFVIESIGKHYPADVLAVERAALIYYICWFIVKSYSYEGTRNFCCDLSRIGPVRMVSLLKLSFILCRDVPLLFQKVSRLLATMYILSTSLKQFSLSPNEEDSESQWASFFHQASLGTQLNQQILSGMLQKNKSEIASDSEDYLPNSVSAILDLPSYIRPSPDTFEDLEEFVLNFFQGLPSVPVICISLVAGVDAGLLRELLHIAPEVRAWILLSHLSSDNQHVILLPVHEILEGEASDDDVNSVVFNCKDFIKPWQCPWVSSVIDDIAPVFRHVLEGNYYSSSDYFLECIRENASLWWTQRKRLDECLSNFLQDMEDLWLGTWKYLFFGKWPDCNSLDSEKGSLSKDERRLLQLVITKKCYVGQKSDASSKSSFQLENVMQLFFERMLEMSDNSDEAEHITGKPIILVLDTEVQMLPWENLPILRNQEVYRMPSIGSIFATLDRFCGDQQFETSIPVFPLIDPLDSYYLLNPDGDLSRTQVEFESWFEDQNIEGKIGTVPTIEELTLALKNHDLFIYFGHGSGTQYIPGHEIQKLDGCAATLLLGCSSGSLYLKGSYMPQGAPLSYILGGSPIIVANLWEVTDKDIDRFGKAMLNAWLRERSAECGVCKSTKCKHRRRIGSFMGQARDACTLGYLIGASPVCYGVPTGIIKRKSV